MPDFERRRWTLSRGAAHARNVLREDGLRALFDRVSSRLGVHRLVALEQRFDGPVAAASPVAPATPPDVTFDEASERDLDALAALRAAEHDEITTALGRPREPVHALLARLFAHGDRCFVVRSDERIVAVSWVGRGRTSVRYLLCDLLLSSEDAYVYDVFVAPEVRGRGLATRLYAHVATVMADSACSRAVMLVRVHNGANLRAAARAGYRRLGTLTCVAARGRTVHFGDALPTAAWP
jgi:ribosomal protein S18 acetylase RimI-like enzyme